MLHPYFRLCLIRVHSTLVSYLLTLIRKRRFSQNLDRRPSRNFCRCLFMDWHRYWVSGHTQSSMTQCPDMCHSHIASIQGVLHSACLSGKWSHRLRYSGSHWSSLDFIVLIVNVLSDSRILDTFQSANYIFFPTEMFHTGSFAYELLAKWSWLPILKAWLCLGKAVYCTSPLT